MSNEKGATYKNKAQPIIMGHALLRSLAPAISVAKAKTR